MVQVITLGQAGETVTATVPKDMADRLRVGPGDKVYVIETDRGILLTPYDPTLDDGLQAFDDVRRQYRNTLRRLAE